MNNEYVIDLAGVSARKELHERIEAALPVPEWYGKNLDALHDVLTDPCFGGSWLVLFMNCAEFAESMPRYYAAMQQMCRAAADANPGLMVEFAD
jgi:ribonuclease inhibitor